MNMDVSLEKNGTDSKKNFKVQILRGTILLILMTTMIAFFFDSSEDPDFQNEGFQFSQINLTENPTATATMTSMTTGKCSLQVISPCLPK